jgi:hypothetical protein
LPAPRPALLSPKWALALAGTIALACVTSWPLFFPSTPAPHKSAPPPPSVSTPRQPISPNFRTAPQPQPPDQASAPVIPTPGPSEAELLDAEIHAIDALHRSRFCLNTSITIERVGLAVEVAGIVHSADERDRITALLTPLAPQGLLRVRLTDAASLADALAEITTPAAVAPEPAALRGAPPIAAWFQPPDGRRPRRGDREVLALMNVVATGAEHVSSEAWAIRRLAERFPPARLRGANPGAEEQVLQMVDDHAIALSVALRRLQGRLDPTNPPAAPAESVAAPSWQADAIALQGQVEAVVRQLLAAVTAAPKDQPRPSDDELQALVHTLESRIAASLNATADFRSRPGLAKR